MKPNEKKKYTAPIILEDEIVELANVFTQEFGYPDFVDWGGGQTCDECKLGPGCVSGNPQA